MQELVGDLWQFSGWHVIPTNTTTNTKGEAVMGAGVAKQAATRFPSIPRKLGRYLQNGQHGVITFAEEGIIAFPTKHHWSQKSSIDLIKRSAVELGLLARRWHYDGIFMPVPGVGLGGLADQAQEIISMLREYLPYDNVFLVRRKPYNA